MSVTKAEELAEQRRRIYDRDTGICGLCGEPVAFEAMHLDHVVAYVAGGTDDDDNLQATHADCNLRAGAKGHTGPRIATTVGHQRPMTFRLAPASFDLLARLKAKMHLSATSVIVTAIRELAKKEGADAMSAPADRPAARREYSLEELIPFGGGQETQDANRAELARLRAIAAAAEAHRAAYLAWHNWRPCAGMGHGYADRYAATRDALWAALTPVQEQQP